MSREPGDESRETGEVRHRHTKGVDWTDPLTVATRRGKESAEETVNDDVKQTTRDGHPRFSRLFLLRWEYSRGDVSRRAPRAVPGTHTTHSGSSLSSSSLRGDDLHTVDTTEHIPGVGGGAPRCYPQTPSHDTYIFSYDVNMLWMGVYTY